MGMRGGAVFLPQPVEQRALGLLLAGRHFDRAADEIGSNRGAAVFRL